MGFVTVTKLCGGGAIKGHKILSFQELKEIYQKEHVSIIVTMGDPDDIEQVLRGLEGYGMLEVKCYTYFALKFTIEFHINDPRINDSYRKNFFNARTAFWDYSWNSRVNRVRQVVYSSMLYDAVLIWQVGKVGSLSLEKSLRKRNIRCIHTHRLSSDGWMGPRRNMPSKIQSDVGDHIKLDLLNNLKQVKIISMIRDPIGRSISNYFEFCNMDGYFFGANKDDGDFDIYKEINGFLRTETQIDEYGYMFEWFDHEIKEICDIDVYEYDFDRERGYQIIYKDNIELLLIKTEKLNDCQDIIGQFVGVEDFKLVKDNVGNKKISKFAYDEVLRTIEIPEDVIDFYYKGNKAMDHFYTESEKEKFMMKWSKR